MGKRKAYTGSKSPSIDRKPTSAAETVIAKSQMNPLFSFKFADRNYGGEWEWPKDQESQVVLDYLCDIAKSTWNELRLQTTGNNQRQRRFHGHEFDQIASAAQARIKTLRLHETFDQIHRFRLSGTGRLWGFEREGVFHVLWWDAKHKVYPLED